MRENMHELVKFLQRFDKPVIAAVNGAAVAGGLTLALSCDFRIAAESAKLGDTSLRFGLLPDEGGAYFFPRFLPLDRALKMSLLSEVYTAREAAALGLVTEVVPDAELMPAARTWATRLAEGPPIATGRPNACARRQMSFICWRWICMPLTRTASAHSKSSRVAARRFSSTKRTGHCSGR